MGCFDSLGEDPVNFYRQVCSFLGVTPQQSDEALQRKVLVGESVDIDDDLKSILVSHYIGEVRKMCDAELSVYANRWRQKYEF